MHRKITRFAFDAKWGSPAKPRFEFAVFVLAASDSRLRNEHKAAEPSPTDALFRKVQIELYRLCAFPIQKKGHF